MYIYIYIYITVARAVHALQTFSRSLSLSLSLSLSPRRWNLPPGSGRMEKRRRNEIAEMLCSGFA